MHGSPQLTSHRRPPTALSTFRETGVAGKARVLQPGLVRGIFIEPQEDPSDPTNRAGSGNEATATTALLLEHSQAISSVRLFHCVARYRSYPCGYFRVCNIRKARHWKGRRWTQNLLADGFSLPASTSLSSA